MPSDKPARTDTEILDWLNQHLRRVRIDVWFSVDGTKMFDIRLINDGQVIGRASELRLAVIAAMEDEG